MHWPMSNVQVFEISQIGKKRRTVPNLKGYAAPNLMRTYFHSSEPFLSRTLIFSLIWVIFLFNVGIFTNSFVFNVGIFTYFYFSRTMSKKRLNRNTPLQSRHALEFGLQICDCSAGTSTTVVTTVCRFSRFLERRTASSTSRRSFGRITSLRTISACIYVLCTNIY